MTAPLQRECDCVNVPHAFDAVRGFARVHRGPEPCAPLAMRCDYSQDGGAAAWTGRCVWFVGLREVHCGDAPRGAMSACWCTWVNSAGDLMEDRALSHGAMGVMYTGRFWCGRDSRMTIMPSRQSRAHDSCAHARSVQGKGQSQHRFHLVPSAGRLLAIVAACSRPPSV
jgi:hypothetical protein